MIYYPTLHKYRLFSDTNGEAVLSDLIFCIVTEQRNGEYKLEAKLPSKGIGADIIDIGDIIMAQPNPYAERTQPFRIIKLNKEMNGNISIQAEHLSRKLNGVMCKNFTAGYADIFMQAITSRAQLNLNPTFVFSSNIVRLPDSNHVGNNTPPRSVMSLLCDEKDSICTMFPEGALLFDRDQVKFRDDRGKNRGAVIDYGLNLADLKQELSAREFPTSGYPFYYRAPSDTYTPAYVELPEKVLDYGYSEYSDIQFTEPIDLSSAFSEPPTESALRSEAINWINQHFNSPPPKTITVSKADIPGDAEIHLCDTVRVRYPKFRIDAEYPVVETVYNVLTDKYNQITLGALQKDLADTILNLSKR